MLVVFSNSACTEQAIQTDCQSAGATGLVAGPAVAIASRAQRITGYFKAPKSGMVYALADSASTRNEGKFDLTIERINAPPNATCNTATKLTLSGGKVTVHGDTGPRLTPDEFPNVDCGEGAMVGGQVYYRLAMQAGKSYEIKIAATAASNIISYVFSGGCNAAEIQKSCASGTTGTTTKLVGVGGEQSVVFSPATAGTYTIAVDSDRLRGFGAFTLTVSEK